VHQEFKLPVPADKDLVRREYIDGVLLVTAPKKGLGIF
jgi:HSP20 family molecular chaperone IbpA